MKRRNAPRPCGAALGMIKLSILPQLVFGFHAILVDPAGL